MLNNKQLGRVNFYSYGILLPINNGHFPLAGASAFEQQSAIGVK